VKHGKETFTSPDYARQPIDAFAREWLLSLQSRPRPVSPQTVTKYEKSLRSYLRSVEAAGEEPVLANLTKASVDRWVSQQRFRGLAAEGIASRLASLKAFTRSYLWREAEVTTYDVLEKVQRPKAPEVAKPMLDEAERAAIFDAFADGGYEDTRNDALVAVLLASFLRLGAVLSVTVEDVGRAGGQFVVVEKGGAEKPVQLGPQALKKVRRWLRVRRAAEGVDALWTTAAGTPLTVNGAQAFFTRLKKRSGVGRVHAHLFRHTAGQGALLKGATPGEVQDLLGHKSSAMTRRYTQTVRARVAATNMPKYALV